MGGTLEGIMTLPTQRERVDSIMHDREYLLSDRKSDEACHSLVSENPAGECVTALTRRLNAAVSGLLETQRETFGVREEWLPVDHEMAVLFRERLVGRFNDAMRDTIGEAEEMYAECSWDFGAQGALPKLSIGRQIVQK